MAMTFEQAVQRSGFATIPDVFPAAQMDRLLTEVEESTLPRSRAGIRHALRHPAVAAIAQASLLKMARQFSAGRQFPSVPRCSTSQRLRIGWWCGTRTPPCPSGKESTFRAGDHGQPRMECCTHRHRHKHFRKCSPCVFTLMLNREQWPLARAARNPGPGGSYR